ncbi:Phytanoyl-CoA dioxygenase [Caenispirillum salinarum AK4]|uniref:Phytanoyl-CoA dioxygenase n=1 Tax=Caenispirillum salinarum AK4 TaxID=1238182 RepID=K9HHV1_9PROT|nr:phytanoyl-CoA dioxygenase family protein [Caenispirillum salinarum]EKV28176.1 Phytanoyl-CoA dioxygenase [Caenispirillum salinarum AK4]
MNAISPATAKTVPAAAATGVRTLSAASTPVEDVHAALKRDGAVVLTDLVPGEVIDRVDADLSAYLDRTPFCEGNFFGWKTRRHASVLAKSRASHDLCANPFILDVVKGMLLPWCDSIQLSGTQTIQIHPGEPEQLLHADEELWPVERGRMEYQMNVVWALSDFTAENGATRILPGSHKDPEIERLPDDSRIVQAEMPRGSAAVWLGSTVHGGGANRSAAPRTGLSMAYCLGWLRQAENQYLANPPEIAKTYSRELQELIGYNVHNPNLGCFEGQDPRILLEMDGRPDILTFKDYMPEWAAELLEEFCAIRDGKKAA